MNVSEQFGRLEEEMKAYLPILGKASEAIMDQEVSDYPIFIAHQQESIGVGLLIAEREQVRGNWTLHASTLEEFVTKQLIQADRVEDFKRVYKEPKDYICVFIIQEIGATFVFIPRD